MPDGLSLIKFLFHGFMKCANEVLSHLTHQNKVRILNQTSIHSPIFCYCIGSYLNLHLFQFLCSVLKESVYYLYRNNPVK